MSRGARRRRRAGLAPIKLNVVVMRGINDDEVDRLRAPDARASVARALHRAHAGRRDARAARGSTSCRATRCCARIGARRRRSTPTPGRRAATDRRRTTAAPARAGTIGVITPMTHTYCASLQPRAPHGRRPTAHVPVRRSRGRSAHAAARRRAARAVRSATRSPTSRRSTRCSQMRVGGLRALSQVGG